MLDGGILSVLGGVVMRSKPRVLVSQCLMGIDCRYDGGSVMCPALVLLMDRYELIPVCPEILGGLMTPRVPAERVGQRILTRDGQDVTAAFERGAEQALRLAKLYGAEYALFKQRSPSCGFGEIYDGTFTGTKVPGNGLTAQLFAQSGIRVYGETQVDQLIEQLEGDGQ